MTPENVLARVATILPLATPAPPDRVRGQAVVSVPREVVLDVLGTLRDDPELALDALTDLTAVDYLPREPRFEVVYQLNSMTHHHRLRVRAVAGETNAAQKVAVGDTAGREDQVTAGRQFVGGVDAVDILNAHSLHTLLLCIVFHDEAAQDFSV